MFALGGIRRGLLVGCAAAVGLALSASPAFAGVSFPFLGQLSGARFSYPQEIAVDDVSGQVLVADSSPAVVDVFDASSRTLVTTWDGSNTPAPFGGETTVAVDNSTGDVYVADAANNVIDKFDSSGAYLCQITGLGSASTSSSECDTSAAGPGALNSPVGLAVDQATGNLYVADTGHDVVDEFDSSGKYLSQITGPTGGSFAYPQSVAINSASGQLLVADSTGHVYVFDAGTGSYVTNWDGSAASNPPGTPAGTFGSQPYVAADDTTGDVYVSAYVGGGSTVDDLTSAGAYRGQITGTPSGPFSQTRGVGVDQASGDIYVADRSNQNYVDVFGRGVLVPDVTVSPASDLQTSSATLNGQVDPAGGGAVTGCKFEYVDAAHYYPSDLNPYFAATTAACSPPTPYSATTAVTAAVSGLTPNTTYHFRLDGSNANGVNFSADGTFTTLGPVIGSATATGLTSTSADLNAQINPVGDDATYHFEYGTSTGYGTSVPVPDADIGAGNGDVSVTQHITGLSANTTYHWRVVATNTVDGQTVTGPDHTFIYDTTTPPGLPDGRAYEQVTPVHKNAALVTNGGNSRYPLDISADGSRIMFRTTQCFADASSCNALYDNTTGEPYLATRTGGGWATTALAPPASLGPHVYYNLNADTGTALLNAAPPPAGQNYFYARRPDSTFSQIGPVTPQAGENTAYVGPLAGTADLSTTAFQTETGWPFDATTAGPGGTYAYTSYEYSGTDNSQPVLVGVTGGEGSTDLISACGTSIGPDQGIDPPGTLSADGNTIYFTAESAGGAPCPGGSGANAGTPVPVPEVGARIDGTLPDAHTVIISQRSVADCTTSACLSSTAGWAFFVGASSDGSKAFFTSTQQLTDDATNDSADASQGVCTGAPGANGCNLYLYDFSNPAGHELVDVSAGDTSGHGPGVMGVVGLSSDGSHVYFIANGVLAAGAQPGDCHYISSAGVLVGNCSLYVYERDSAYPSGHTAFIATVSADTVRALINTEVANVTPDGRYLVFPSAQPLTAEGANQGGAQNIYRYDAQTGQLIRISVGNDGYNDNGNSGTGDATIVPALEGMGRLGTARLDPTMSDDGSYVFFQSPIALTPHALDDVSTGTDSTGHPTFAQNVYEWHGGRVYLISDGRDASASNGFCAGDASATCLLGTDSTGANVFFTTVDQLVPQDTDTQLDIYDARIGGGFPYTPPTVCTGAACQGSTAAPPAVPTAGSVTFTGPGNSVSGAGRARVRLLARAVRGVAFRLRVRVPGAGRLAIAGPGVRRMHRAVRRAGTFSFRVRLTARERRILQRRHRVRLRLHVAYAPGHGGASSVAFSITDKA